MLKHIAWPLMATLALASHARSDDVMVFAAASLADVMQEVAVVYEREQGERVLFNFDGSSALARQIVAGAPADVFLSADEAKMNALEELDLLLPDTRRSLLSNELVVVGHIDTRLTINAQPDLIADAIARVAIADPVAVPAGIYAMTWLQNAGLWEALETRLIPLQNVRSALAAVASGNADIGIVYRTDATMSEWVKVLYQVPPDQSPDISYPVAIIKGTTRKDAAQKFLSVLISDEARAIFEQHGFGL